MQGLSYGKKSTAEAYRRSLDNPDAHVSCKVNGRWVVRRRK